MDTVASWGKPSHGCALQHPLYAFRKVALAVLVVPPSVGKAHTYEKSKTGGGRAQSGRAQSGGDGKWAGNH